MDFLEKDLEDFIFNSNNNQLDKSGLYFNETSFNKKRQLNLGGYGIADLVVFEKHYYKDYERQEILGSYITINIIELKKDQIGIKAFMQALRYAKGIKDYLEKRKSNIKFYLKITLIGNRVSLENDMMYITDLLSCSEFNKNEYGGLVDIKVITYKKEKNGNINFKYQFGKELLSDRFEIKK